MELKNTNSFLKVFAKLYQKGEKTLLAFSGGADSTALFYLLLAYQKQDPQFYFEAFHLNHNLRGEDAKKDALWVSHLCSRFNIVCHLKEVSLVLEAQKLKLSVEEAGRNIRYDFLKTIQKQQNLESITTAHHKSDNIETLLMRLFTGGGLLALGGMRNQEKNKRRPLLSFFKEELLAFLKVNSLSYQEDNTNKINNVPRNQIRNVILPCITQYFLLAPQKIAEFQELLQEREKWVQSLLPHWQKIFFEVFVSLKDFFKIPKALQKDFLLKGVQFLKQGVYLRKVVLEKLLKDIEAFQGHGHKIFLQTKHIVIVGSYNQIFLLESKDYHPPCFYKTLKPQEIFTSYHLEIKALQEGVLKTAKKGYRVSFFKSKKLQDFLVDQKIPFHRRKYVVVLEKDHRFLGVLDFLGGNFWLNQEGKKVVEIKKAPLSKILD